MAGKAMKSSISSTHNTTTTNASTPTSDNNDMATTTTTTTTTNNNTNTKGLSCLRCRKKKAKCSKTRPTCTRCARSNQPCEYPDAPPNLTDLSQKVLTLYDTLRQLEGEFLVKYMQSLDGENNTTTLTENDTWMETMPEEHPLDLDAMDDGKAAENARCSVSIATGADAIATTDQLTPMRTVRPSLKSNGSDGVEKTNSAEGPAFKKQKRMGERTATTAAEEEKEKTAAKEETITHSISRTSSNLLEPAGWSMTLTNQGLSIHAVTRTLSEFNEFAKNLTRQLMRDFGASYLPPHWDAEDEEGYYYYVEEEGGDAVDGLQQQHDQQKGYYYDYQEDELDEDEYLVRVPVYSTRSLFFSEEDYPLRTNTIISTLKQQGKGETSRDVVRTLLNGAETLVSIIESHIPHMIQHLDRRYEWLDKQMGGDNESSIPEGKDEEWTNVPHHLYLLMRQLERYLPTSTTLATPTPTTTTTTTTTATTTTFKGEPLTQICILTGYVVSVTLLPRIADLTCPPLPTSLWRNCAEYATMLLVELVLSSPAPSFREERGAASLTTTFPLILCAVLLAWIDTDVSLSNEYKADTIVHIALRVLCGSHVIVDWEKHDQQEQRAWQILIASLLYLDVYSATFRFRRPQMKGEGMSELWDVAVQMPSQHQAGGVRETGVILEARLMRFLSKVICLFYQVEDEEEKDGKKEDSVEEEEEEDRLLIEKEETAHSVGQEDDGSIVKDDDLGKRKKKKKRKVQIRKIDVDDVLTLVRDMELWEQELPTWAKWDDHGLSKEKQDAPMATCTMTSTAKTTKTATRTKIARGMQACTAGVVMHMHMIHNLIKILLFRPFSTITKNYDDGPFVNSDRKEEEEEEEEEEEQTLTKTTFLDMSLSSADRLSVCLASLQHKDGFIGFWHKTALHLIQDVCDRALTMFDKDEEVLHQVMMLKQRLKEGEIKGRHLA